MKSPFLTFIALPLNYFEIILTAVIEVAIFIVGNNKKIKRGKEKILAQGIKGIMLFAVPIVILSIIGIVLNKDLHIGVFMVEFEDVGLILMFFSLFLCQYFV